MTPVYRSRVTLVFAVVLSVLVTAVTFLVWFAFPAEVRGRFTWLQLLTLISFLVIGVGWMIAMALSSVRPDAVGLTVRNGLRTTRLPWSEVAGIRYRQGDPWAYAQLVDGHPSGRERVMLLGIQQVDGDRARRAVADLRSRLASSRSGT